MTKTDLNKLSEILDEHIEKGERIAQRDRMRMGSRIDQYEESLSKGLTFDPFAPVSVGEDSPYYNPYAQHPSGGFYPHPSESWTAGGNPSHLGTMAGTRGEDGYRANNEFYRVAGDAPMDAHLYAPAVVQSQSRFAQVRKSIDDLFKGGPVPVGTTHTYADGQVYKKVAEGKWHPVAGMEKDTTRKYLTHEDPKIRTKANQLIEEHATKKTNLHDMIKQRKRDDEVVGRAKNEAVTAAAEHTKTMVSKLYDGKVPKEVEAEHQKTLAAHGGAKADPKAVLEKEGESLKPKTHHVSVRFSHQGKEYTHKFENVHGNTAEAINRVQDILKQKLPGHQLTGIKAEVPRAPKEPKETPRRPEARA